MIVAPVMLKAEVTPCLCVCVVESRERGAHGKRWPSCHQGCRSLVMTYRVCRRRRALVVAVVGVDLNVEDRMYLSSEMRRSDETTSKHNFENLRGGLTDVDLYLDGLGVINSGSLRRVSTHASYFLTPTTRSVSLSLSLSPPSTMKFALATIATTVLATVVNAQFMINTPCVPLGST